MSFHYLDKLPIMATAFLQNLRSPVTGLGLSLAYDIIKAHGRELKVETEEGKGFEFIVLLLI